MSGERDLTPLEAAMASSFEYSPDTVQRKVHAAPPAPPAAAVAPSDDAQEPPLTGEDAAVETEWKEEYDSRLSEWRAAATVQRVQAERERARWEAVRAEEAKAGVERAPLPEMSAAAASLASVTSSGWQSVGQGSTVAGSAAPSVVAAPRDSPSPADVRDVVAGEQRGGRGGQVLESVLGPRPTAPARTSTADVITTDEDSAHSASQWEQVPSRTSSFPSLPSSKPAADKALAVPGTPASAGKARSITLLLFDASTDARTRLLALVATVGINLLLPFVNGMMIGFGELAAKGVVNWWRGGRALSVTAAGLRSAHPIV